MALREMFNKIGSPSLSGLSRSTHPIRTGVEALATGGVLGALHATVGLDVKGKYPVDLGVGVVALASSAASRSADMENVGAVAMGTFAFRQTFGFMSEKQLAKGLPVKGTFRPLISSKAGALAAHGDFDIGEDPILALARTL